MNELITLVTQKTGISQEQAQQAVQVVLNFLKTKLPAPLAGHLDSFLTGGLGGGLGALEAEASEMLKGKLGGLS